MWVFFQLFGHSTSNWILWEPFTALPFTLNQACILGNLPIIRILLGLDPSVQPTAGVGVLVRNSYALQQQSPVETSRLTVAWNVTQQTTPAMVVTENRSVCFLGPKTS